MEKLLEGMVQFQSKDFEEHRELFTKLSKHQKPHTLFIGCSDSRVVPNLITGALPGELFMVRNIANLVPPYRETQEYVATTSAIEYAVQVLEVEDIVICGHSNCGGCAALFEDEKKLNQTPNVKKWLELATGVKKKVEATLPQGDLISRIWLAEQVNIVEQMKHLLTYPFILKKYQEEKLKISGLYYIIETGEIYAYNQKTGFFNKILAQGNQP